MYEFPDFASAPFHRGMRKRIKSYRLVNRLSPDVGCRLRAGQNSFFANCSRTAYGFSILELANITNCSANWEQLQVNKILWRTAEWTLSSSLHPRVHRNVANAIIRELWCELSITKRSDERTNGVWDTGDTARTFLSFLLQLQPTELFLSSY